MKVNGENFSCMAEKKIQQNIRRVVIAERHRGMAEASGTCDVWFTHASRGWGASDTQIPVVIAGVCSAFVIYATAMIWLLRS